MIIVVAVMANGEDRDVAIFNVGMRDVTRAFDFEKRYMPRFAEGNNPLPQEGIGIVHFAARKTGRCAAHPRPCGSTRARVQLIGLAGIPWGSIVNVGTQPTVEQ